MLKGGGRAAVWLCLGAAGAAAAAPGVDEVLAALDGVRQVHDLALSPDGAYVAWNEKLRRADGGDSYGRLTVAPAADGAPRPVSAARAGAPAREQNPAFSPDGRRLAFLSDAGSPGQLQIYVAAADGSAPRRLTDVKGSLADPRWSPDGRQIAVLFVAGATHEPGALVAHAKDSGVVADKPEIQRIALVDAQSGALRELSPPGLYVYDYDWAPDGRWLAAEAAQGSGTNDYWVAELFRVELGGGARSLWKPPLQLAVPRVAPDGRGIAVIHGLMSDEGSNGGDVFWVPAEGGAPRNLTPGLPASVKDLSWRKPDELLLVEHRDGGFALESLSPAGGPPKLLWSGAYSVAAFAAAPGGPQSAVARHGFASAPEVWVGPIGEWRQRSSLNPQARTFWGEARSLHWPSDGAQVQGFLLPPPQVEPGKRYPLVVVVHGGPAGVAAAGWPTRWVSVLPSQGYYVLLPNPRGSFGFGEAFTQGNVKDFGYGDLRDILAGVDAALQAAPIDPERLGVAGWSYGGYMAMWAPTQTARFKAAVAGAGITSWQSYYGQNRIDRWMIPYFGASVYEDPWIYARSAPITFIKQHRTPTLVLHGERDSEVPAPQGYEHWHALRTLGVPTQLVIYPDEGHAVQQREHQTDIQRRSVEWLDRYLK